MDFIERTYTSNDWISFVLLFILTVLVIIKLLNREQFLVFVQLPFTGRFSGITPKNSLANVFNGLFFLVHVLSMALLVGFFIRLTYQNQEPQLLSFTKYIQIAVAYSVFLLGKYLIEKIVASIFNVEHLIDQYLYYKISFKSYLSFIVIPVCILFTYTFTGSYILIVIGLGIVGLFNLLFLINYFIKNQEVILVNWLYFILYLCALEIGPYVILYKLIVH
ncbi:DUF4271 domain-containing protein [Gangjinia marincola]|uniref:DUF4271 domain-containing protein n=1 Tax=Gangjinia marincola TaxID=578463 RepID=A0ABP3XXA3_9FLAO